MKMSEVLSTEVEIYHVRQYKDGYGIFLDDSNCIHEPELIFGTNCTLDSPHKAFLDYWCMRLNRAFINGWFGAQGKSSWPAKDYYARLDQLCQKWCPPK